MSTLTNLVEEVLLNLEGFGTLQDTVALASLGSVDGASGYTKVTLTSPQLTEETSITPVLLEVQDELLYVANSTFFAPNLVCQVRRAYRGTTQATFATPEYARVNPRFPRSAVKRAINDTLSGLFPRLPAVKTSEINYLAHKYRYDIPADARNILAVSVKALGHQDHWNPSRYWTFDATGGSGSVTSKSIDIRDANPGRPFRVVYTASPTTLSSNSSTFASTGLPDWAREIVIYGACWRLASFMETSTPTAVPAEQMLNQIESGMTGRQSVARYFLGMFETRLAEGEARMQDEYPAPRHYIR